MNETIQDVINSIEKEVKCRLAAVYPVGQTPNFTVQEVEAYIERLKVAMAAGNEQKDAPAYPSEVFILAHGAKAVCSMARQHQRIMEDAAEKSGQEMPPSLRAVMLMERSAIEATSAIADSVMQKEVLVATPPKGDQP